MGRIQLDSISDFARHGYNAKVTCEGCGNVSIWNASELQMQLRARRKSLRVEEAERTMRCGVCGENRAIILPIERD